MSRQHKKHRDSASRAAQNRPRIAKGGHRMTTLTAHRRTPAFLLGVVLAALIAAGVALPTSAADRHAGYYYPPITSEETYVARAAKLADASRDLRIQFIVNITQQMLSKPYPPDYIIFAKGDEAEKMIIVGLNEYGGLSTLFRARATLAMLTGIARGSKLFQDAGVDDFFTFFDLAKLFGFEQITVSNGRDYAHQIQIK